MAQHFRLKGLPFWSIYFFPRSVICKHVSLHLPLKCLVRHFFSNCPLAPMKCEYHRYRVYLFTLMGQIESGETKIIIISNSLPTNFPPREQFCFVKDAYLDTGVSRFFTKVEERNILFFFSWKFHLFILFWAVLNLPCCTRAFSSAMSRGYSLL